MSTPEESAVPTEQDTTAAEPAAEDTDATTTEDPQPDGDTDSGGSPIRPDHVRSQP
jgi:hypothetical protein